MNDREAECILQIGKYAEEEKTEVDRAKGQDELWEKRCNRTLPKFKMWCHYCVISTNYDQTGYRHIDRLHKRAPDLNNRLVLTGIGYRSLLENIDGITNKAIKFVGYFSLLISIGLRECYNLLIELVFWRNPLDILGILT